jgi:hypothetical protein
VPELPRFRSYKEVGALTIERIEPIGEGPPQRWLVYFEEEGFAPAETEPGMFARYHPRPGDKWVVYADGYKSISPRAAFEEGYAPASLFAQGPDGREVEASGFLPTLFRTRYRRLSPEELELHDQIKGKADELVELFCRIPVIDKVPPKLPNLPVGVLRVMFSPRRNIDLALEHLEDSVYRAVKALTT